MTTISPNRKLVTLINVFTVEPKNQQKLIELLARATETSVRHTPGFISASLHRGLDGTKVAMCARN
jgi:quinol monooxygenase YgiN